MSLFVAQLNNTQRNSMKNNMDDRIDRQLSLNPDILHKALSMCFFLILFLLLFSCFYAYTLHSGKYIPNCKYIPASGIRKTINKSTRGIYFLYPKQLRRCCLCAMDAMAIVAEKMKKFEKDLAHDYSLSLSLSRFLFSIIVFILFYLLLDWFWKKEKKQQKARNSFLRMD